MGKASVAGKPGGEGLRYFIKRFKSPPSGQTEQFVEGFPKDAKGFVAFAVPDSGYGAQKVNNGNVTVFAALPGAGVKVTAIRLTGSGEPGNAYSYPTTDVEAGVMQLKDGVLRYWAAANNGVNLNTTYEVVVWY